MAVPIAAPSSPRAPGAAPAKEKAGEEPQDEPERLTHTVVCQPKAEVYRNGKRVGETPWSVETVEGARLVRVELRAQGRASRKVGISHKSPRRIVVKLKPAAKKPAPAAAPKPKAPAPKPKPEPEAYEAPW